MRFQCQTHGELDELHLDGYSIAHNPEVKASERDLEGITFVIDSPQGGEVQAEHVHPEESMAESYLEKFSGWDEDIARAVRSFYHNAMSVEEFSCPHDHTGMSITHIVDDVFVPDLSFEVQFEEIGVFDDQIEIMSIMGLAEDDVDMFVDELMDAARSTNASSIRIQLTTIDPYRSVLDSYGFDTEVETKEKWGETYDELTARADI